MACCAWGIDIGLSGLERLWRGRRGNHIHCLSGLVIDGYIEGAEVCLDLNNNQACDAGEPKATTGKDGSYKLDTTGRSMDQIKAAHLLTNVPSTAKDADDGGQTLAEAGKSEFNLLAPAAAYVKADGSATAAVISPLTTLVSHEMLTSNTPLDTAQNNVRTRLSLTAGTVLTQDFVAKGDATLKEKAQVLTAAIGEVKAQALQDTVTAPTDKQALFAALQYLQTQATELQKAVDDAKAKNSSAKPNEWVKKVIKTDTVAKPVMTDLVAEAKKTTDSSAVTSIAGLIEQGFYSANHVLEDCSGSSCAPTYSKIQGSAGKVSTDTDYELSTTGWAKAADKGHDWTLTSTGWKSENTCATGQSATYSVGSDGVTIVTFCSGVTERVTARKVDAASKTLKGLGLNPPEAYASVAMPTGSELYWIEFANTDDKYYLYTGDAPSKTVWDSTQKKFTQQEFSTLDGLVSGSPTPSVSGIGTVVDPSALRTWSGLGFSFDAGGTSSGGSLTLWSGVNANNPTVSGKGTYTRKTVFGQELLIINAQAPENSKGEWVMFTVKDGKVYGGTYRSAAVRQTSQPLFNKTMMNAILKAGNKPAVLD